MLDNIKDPAGNRINEGYYEIQYKENGVFLTVYPPVGKGKRVESREIVERLTLKKVKDFKRELVEDTAMKALKIPVKIAEHQEEHRIDSVVNVSTSADKMKASIVLTPPDGGKVPDMQHIIEALSKQSVVYGVDKATLENLVKYPVYNQNFTIANGTPSVKGQNGKINYHFDIHRESKPTILEDGRVDFRELNLIESVQAGQILCSLLPPLPGVPGKTVVGTDIPAIDGKPGVLPKGKNVEITPDGQSLMASINGQVSYIDGKVNVFANYEVAADVDNSTGNIDFIGNVIIRGNVLSGFVVDAGGNVEVWGVVEGAVIKAGGDIILRRGMQGLGKGELISGGDIIAKYIENSTIEARGDIKSEAIMHSNVKCGNKLELSGRKGLLVGGTCKVGKEVSAKVIGSYMATVTDIEVGTDPSLKDHYKNLKQEIAQIEEDIKKADQAITLLKKLEAIGQLTPEKQDIMAKSVRTKLYYSNRIEQLKEELVAIELKLQEEANGKVKAFSYIYPGTKVTIGTCMKYIKENMQNCSLYRDGADIKVGSG